MDVSPLPITRDDATGPGRLAGCITVTLEQPGSPVVVLDLPLIQRLEVTLKRLAHESPAPAGLILASGRGRVFVAGADLKTIQDLDDAGLDRYLAYGQRVFGLLAEMPCPTVAAINGAALGGGLEIAMHCDGLVAAPPAPPPAGKPYPVGLPEAGLGICPGWGGTNLLPARMNAAEAIRRTAAGKPLLFEEARQAGLFDVVAEDPGDLMAAAKRWLAGRKTPPRDGAPARWIGRLDRKAMALAALTELLGELPEEGPSGAVVRCVRAGLERGWQAALETERRELVRQRNTPEAKAAIRAFFERSKK